MLSLLWLAVIALSHLTPVHADSNGMDMSMDGAMDLASGTMKPYLHFTLGDILWFQGWSPQNAGAMVGACIGLFLLAIVERWIGACRSLMEAHWRKKSQMIMTNKLNAQRPSLGSRAQSSVSTSSNDKEKARASVEEEVEEFETGTARRPSDTTKGARILIRTVPPFIASHDIPRGVIYAGQVALEFAFMLAVMTYQVGFIMSIVIGLGVGETLFGRYNTQSHLY